MTRLHSGNNNENRIFTPAADVWSFSLLMWNIYTYGETPFQGEYPRLNIPQLVANLSRNVEVVLDNSLIRDNMRPNLGVLENEYDECFCDITKIIKTGWSSQPGDRGLISKHAEDLM